MYPKYIEKLPSGFFAHPSKIGWTFCPEVNLNPNGSGLPWAPAPRGAARTRTRAPAQMSHRKCFAIATLYSFGVLRRMCAGNSRPAGRAIPAAGLGEEAALLLLLLLSGRDLGLLR